MMAATTTRSEEERPPLSTDTDFGRWSLSRIARRRFEHGGGGDWDSDDLRLRRPWRPSWPWTWSGIDYYGSVGGGAPIPEPPAMLRVESVDQLIASNRRRHHTTDYEVGNLVLRRGQPFQLELKLSRSYDPSKDKIRVELQSGRVPLESNGSLVVLVVDELNPGGSAAEAMVLRFSGDLLTLSLKLPPDCLVGRFEMFVVTETDGKTHRTDRSEDKDIYVLFNPWCSEDQVFLSHESWRREYVLNDTGCIFLGTSERIGNQPWNFGQFERGILDSCLALLDKAWVHGDSRSDAVAVCRTASAVVNSNDENGVLVGRWSGGYDDGVSPSSWTGSVDILLRYALTGRSVRYGQCWVFSGVVTTVLRCLGIPCRSVTNFNSMHDHNKNLSMDIYLDQDMWPIDSLNEDSIWNFHVWNEAWMARPDLPQGNDGWQIVDSTPQEQSNGLMQCGPAPQIAVKNGHVYHLHDTPFVFAEVNGDRVYWVWGKDWRFHKVYTDTAVIGKNISTKALHSNEREDITWQYKFPEGSQEEREAVARALGGIAGGLRGLPRPEARRRAGPVSRAALSAAEAARDELDVSLDEHDAAVGQDLRMSVRVLNRTRAAASVTVNVQVDVSFYTGVSKLTVKRDTVHAALKPDEEGLVEFSILVSDYLPHLTEHSAMTFTVTARVDETGSMVTKVHAVSLRVPSLGVVGIGDAKVGKEMSAEVTFRNPLPIPLTKVSFSIEGAGLLMPTTKTFVDIAVGQNVSLTQSFTPTKAGARTLMANLQSKELHLVSGTLEVNVVQ